MKREHPIAGHAGVKEMPSAGKAQENARFELALLFFVTFSFRFFFVFVPFGGRFLHSCNFLWLLWLLARGTKNTLRVTGARWEEVRA